MTFRIPINLRYATLTITDEPVAIPLLTPYEYRLAEVPTEAEGVKIRRIGPVTKSGTGTGTMTSPGYFTGMATRNYIFEIDGAGGIGTATFKWKHVDDPDWQGSLIPIDDTDPIPIELGIEVQFSDGTYVMDDTFSFSAEYWTEVTTVPIATKTFQVDYANGLISFFVSDAGLPVYATYEGRGSVVKAEDITQIIDFLDSDAWIVQNLSPLAQLIVVANGDVITHNDEIVYLS
jgi:hypothetical protein